MPVGAGKLAEAIKFETAFYPERLGSATIFYNGNPYTNTAVMIDTRDYDDVTWIIANGTIDGPLVTLTNSIYESDTNDPTAATLLTGSAFTTITNSTTDNSAQEAHIRCKNYKRYQCLYTEIQGATAFTVDFAAAAILGTPDKQAVSKTLQFDL